MNRARRARELLKGFLALGVAVFAVLASAEGLAQSPGGRTDDRVLAEVDGEVITADAVDQALGQPAYKLRLQLYQLRRRHLDNLIETKLLAREAARRGVSVERLLRMEVASKVRVGDEDVRAFYQEHKKSLQAKEAVARDSIRRYLERQQQAELRKRLIESLKTTAGVRDYLRRPALIRAGYLEAPGASFKGVENAPVTIVEFSDFQCALCAKARPLLQQLLDTYPKKIRIVYRHFPLARHPEARRAAEAAECAAAQGKFWEFHDQAFDNGSQLSEAKLKEIAGHLRLDVEDFETCLGSGQARARLAKDLSDARNAEVRSTPTFFVNGRKIEGLPPLATLKRMIELELALRGHARSVN